MGVLNMPIRVVRLGSPREKGEGIRIGTVRRPPRGVPKVDFAKRNFYDVWLPQLAPSAGLVAIAKDARDSASRWKQFERHYLRELSIPDNKRLLEFLAQLSKQTSFSIGCYCENEARCHRSILRKILAEHCAIIHENGNKSAP
jgi:uncharacterized protein YeaO (DUF488 family)